MTAPQQQKLRITGPVVVTGNRLTDGAVVYRDGEHRWTTKLADAAVARTADEALRILNIANADDVGVGAYVAPVALDEDGLKPGNLREQIRLSGPTFELPSSTES